MATAVFTTPNTMSDVGELVARADAFFNSRLGSPRLMYKANLVLEETLTNIVKYAYRDPEVHTITVRLQAYDPTLTIVVEDDGIPFNPLDQAEPQEKNHITEQAVGGLGIHLVKHTAKTLTYKREGGKNILTIRLES